MADEYIIPDQTLEALINLGAKSRFIKFNSIVNEVKKVRLQQGKMAEPSNFKTRIRRSLVNDKTVFTIRGTNEDSGAKVKTIQRNPMIISLDCCFITKTRKTIVKRANNSPGSEKWSGGAISGSMLKLNGNSQIFK